MEETKTIKITVHKGHLVTLGERMYVEAVELIRELVNNAYDADATEVYVSVAPESIAVEDNGSGMDEKGLEQYFNVGSEEKRIRPVSPRFGRKRIGQFGIGKFAALAAADRFAIETKKGKWVFTVTFDKEEWSKKEGWEIPIQKAAATPFHQEGTKVTLTKLKKAFPFQYVEKYLRQTLPLRAKKFTIFLNGRRVLPKFIAGRRIPIQVKTLYGVIEGEIVIAADAKDVEEPGIECRVKQVLVKRELFGFEKMHEKGLNRLSGFVNADFLPLTSGRSDFIRDSEEFKLFYQILHAELSQAITDLKKELNRREFTRLSRELKAVLSDIRRALEQNPDFLPAGRTIVQRRKRLGGGTIAASTVSKKSFPPREAEAAENSGGQEEKKVEGEKRKAPTIVKPAVLKRIRMAKLGISVGITFLGENGPEAISEGNVVYINQDHPLYQKFFHKKELFETHLLRLITQEVVLMKRLRILASEAYEMQSKLLTDALIKK